MSENLSLEKRVEALEAKVHSVLVGFNGILTDTTRIENAEEIQKEAQKEKPKWATSKIKWEEKEGPKGKFERSEDVNNPDFKALVKDLAEHKGKLTHEGYFIWLFENGTTIGKKKKTY